MLRFGVWSALTEMASTWSCHACDGDTRRARGNCGGPFTRDMLDAYPMQQFTDDDGTQIRDGAWEAPDGRIWITADVACSRVGEGAFSSCPVAAARQPWVSHVNACHRAAEAGEMRMLEPHPSAALIDAVGVVAGAVSEVERYKTEKR